ncbi:MAG: ABC transporter permease [Candidatus Zixiibacteriota bacterium]|nr:MAG: ABC transporter permease [candidate division Zixibacteria bacterium]
MFAHNFKSVLRSILKHKSSSLINIIGLAIGMACCLLVSLWIFGEFGYDSFHENVDSTYKVFTQGTSRNNPATPAPLAPALQEQFPEIEYATRFEGFSTSLFSNGDKRFYEYEICTADQSFFKIFSFDFVAGDATTALSDMYSLVITEEVARKYFGDEEALGKVLTKDGHLPFTVGAVIKKPPVNSTFQFDMLVPFDYRIVHAKETTGWDMGWGWFSPSIYVKLVDDCLPAEVEEKISKFFAQRMEDENDGLSLMPFAEYHFWATGSMQYVYIFSTIALLVLVMACINFINLSTARFSDRAKEIGVRKVAGASRRNMYGLLLGESITVALIAMASGMVLVELAVPMMESSTGFVFYLGFTDIPYFLPAMVVAAVLIGVIAGSYPAFYLSSILPAAVIKGELKYGKKGLFLRRALVVVQFSCSVLLIVGTAVIFKQSGYLIGKDMGYAKDHIINIPLNGESVKSYQTLKDELSRNPAIADVSGSAASFPYWRWTTCAIHWDGKNPDEEIEVGMNYVDYGLVETTGIEILEGRSFSEEFPSDLTSGYLVNEEMAKLMGAGSVVGANLTYMENAGQVVGVMKDFHWEPLNRQVRPLVFKLVPDQTKMMAVRVPPGDISAAVESMKGTWEKVVPDYPFVYWTVSESVDGRYRWVVLVGNLSAGLALIAIFVACLGLLGLASFIAEKRNKEISVRKVLGASVWSIVRLLSREHLLLALLASLLTFPIAYLLMRSWLSNFAYHTSIAPDDFLLAGAMALGIVLISVSSQALKAATSNPIDSLRSE